MANLNVQNVSLSGLNPAFSPASAGGDSIPNNTGDIFLVVKNAGGAQITTTVNSTQQCNYGFDHDVAVNVPAGEERWVGPFNASRFGATVGISYSGVTNVTVAAVRMTRV